MRVSLFLLRLVFAFSFGYVHPDEHHQCPEVMAHSVCQKRLNFTRLTWEWTEEHALRSPIVPGLTIGWLYYLFGCSSPALLFFLPRLSHLMMSFIIDMLVPFEASHLIAICWPMLILQTRPFSNSIESLLLCVLLYMERQRRAPSELSLALILSVGLWCRFTFPIFALVPTLFILWRRYNSNNSSIIIWYVARLALYAFLFCALFVTIDSAFYRKWTLTPVNALLYNVNTANVAQHGIHPRYLHAFVNMPMLYLPMLYSCAASMRRHFFSVCSLTVVVSLLLLSISPHQEPRFLLPLAVPVAILASQQRRRNTRLTLPTILFNVGMACFFGFFHQAGVVPMLIFGNVLVGDFAGVYMPPGYLQTSIAKETLIATSRFFMNGWPHVNLD